MKGVNVAAFMEGPVMILLSTCGKDRRAHIACGSGARFDRDRGRIEVLFSSAQWRDVAENAAPERPIAVTFTRPSDYRTYQVKGRIDEVAPAQDADAARGRAYVESMTAEMARLGISPSQLSHTLVATGLARIRFRPTDLFVQTPGPDAGARIDIERL